MYRVTADSERLRKNTTSFESSGGSAPPPLNQTPPPSSAMPDQTDAGSTTPTITGRFGVTVSVVDTERDTPLSSSSLGEEFDHLEILVNTLNDTVSSMTGTKRIEGSDTSVVIDNNSTLHGSNAVLLDGSNATSHGGYGKAARLDSGGDFGANYGAGVRLTPRSEHYYYHSSSTSRGDSPHPLTNEGGGAESEGSSTSIIKENLVALFDDKIGTKQNRFGSAHSGSNSSMATSEDGKGEGLEKGGFHSNTSLPHAHGNIYESEENFVELLKYGNSADLTMV